jgi:hypothetical protein
MDLYSRMRWNINGDKGAPPRDEEIDPENRPNCTYSIYYSTWRSSDPSFFFGLCLGPTRKEEQRRYRCEQNKRHKKAK